MAEKSKDATISISFKTMEEILKQASLYITSESTKDKIRFDADTQQILRECLEAEPSLEMSKFWNLTPSQFAVVLSAMQHVTNIPVEGVAFVTECEPTGLKRPMVHMVATINIRQR